jgi:hypothetical protein
MVRVQESRKSRPFDDLSSQPDLCNPVAVGSADAGSQKGSQRRQAVTDAGPPWATVMQLNGLSGHARRRSAIVELRLVSGRISSRLRSGHGMIPAP